MKLPGYDGPNPPEKMKDIIAWEKALAELMKKITFVKDGEGS